MINTLFSMHNIKYVISVDDCYYSPKTDEIKAKVYSEMCSSVEPFKSYLTTIGRSEPLEEIDGLSSLGIDTRDLIKDFLDTLTELQLKELFAIAEKPGEPYSIEQSGILAFLQGLKDRGCVDRYLTISSTAEAAQLDCSATGIEDGAILWLLDRNFERVGESAEAGIQLAKTIVQRNTGQDNFVYILSAVEPDSDISEDDIESAFDKVLSADCDFRTSSFVYYINKQRVISNHEKKIEKSLSQGFKRKVCYELFQIYGTCLQTSITASKEKIFGIKQKTLNYLFAQKISDKGESRVDFITRLVEIFQSDEYNKALAVEHDLITEKVSYYERLCDAVRDLVGNSNEMTPILKELRDIELFNKYINPQHLEISTGDIFRIEDCYYLLVSQSCDTYLRKDGCRKLDSASLLRIDQNGPTKYAYKLSCFMDYTNPTIMYQAQRIVPFDILDLCVINNDGQACLSMDCIEHEKQENTVGYTNNYATRLRSVITRIKKLYSSRKALEACIAQDPDITKEDAHAAYEVLLEEEPFLKKYEIVDGKLFYPVQRICRLDELTAVDIVKEYGITLSRIGHPFDFSE